MLLKDCKLKVKKNVVPKILNEKNVALDMSVLCFKLELEIRADELIESK